MNIENVGSIGAMTGGGFVGGLLIGYALKKVVKLVAIVVGLFFAGLTYLHYQQIIGINWNKLQEASQNAVTTLANATTQLPGFNNVGHSVAAVALSNLCIPLTGSMSAGIAIGFLKG